MNTKKYAWQFETEPEPHLDGRRMHCPRGKVLGGSSSINGMVYVRGHAGDFDEWQQAGAQGWDYAHCLPYFKRAEQWAFGGDEYRGAEGPLGVNNGNQMQNPSIRPSSMPVWKRATTGRRITTAASRRGSAPCT